MSDATKYVQDFETHVAALDAMQRAEPIAPSFLGQGISAGVSAIGGLETRQFGTVDAATALAFGQWIVATFGEVK